MFDFINKLTAFLQGNRTYLVALVGALLGLAGALGYQVPDEVLQVLAFLGLYTLRASVANLAARPAAA